MARTGRAAGRAALTAGLARAARREEMACIFDRLGEDAEVSKRRMMDCRIRGLRVQHAPTDGRKLEYGCLMRGRTGNRYLKSYILGKLSSIQPWYIFTFQLSTMPFFDIL